MQDIGRPKFLSDLTELGARLSPDYLATQEGDLREIQKGLRESYDVHYGNRFGGGGVSHVAPSEKDLAQADKLEELIKGIEAVRQSIEEGNRDRKAGQQGGGNRGTLSPQHRDPGDRH